MLEGCIVEIYNIISLDIFDNGKLEIRKEIEILFEVFSKGKIIF